MLILVVVAGTLAVLALAIRFMVAMPGTSNGWTGATLTAVEREVRARLARHLERLAGTIGERNTQRIAALDAASHYIRGAWRATGYGVTAQPFEVRGVEVSNLVAELPGSHRQEEIVVVGAHYDSVVGCPGANDNATGVAALLELARLLRDRKPARTIRFVAFVNEEPPFCFTDAMGSRVYSREARRRGDRIVAMLSLETIGWYSDTPGSQRYPFPFGLFYPRTGNFIGFVGNISSRRLVRRCVRTFRECAGVPSEGVAAPGYLPGIYWSDHWSFWRAGYRAVMVTDTAPFRYPFYHTPLDTPDKIDYDRTAKVVVGLAAVVEVLATDSEVTAPSVPLLEWRTQPSLTSAGAS